MPYKLNIFTGHFDYYQTGGVAVVDGPFDFMDGTDISYMDGNDIDFMAS